MINKTQKIKFRAITHTVQMKVDEVQSLNIQERLQDINLLVDVVKSTRVTQSGLFIPINPNKYINGLDVTTHQDLLMTLEKIRKELMIDEWSIDRQDIALDTEVSYYELEKINGMFISLFAVLTNNTNLISQKSKLNDVERALTIKSRYLDLQIYDKNLESSGKYPYCRCEFRFKLLTKAKEKNNYKKIYKYLRGIPNQIKDLNELMIELLYHNWVKHHNYASATPITNMTEFFNRYGKEIYTIDIARGLYDKINTGGGNFENWLKSYRKNHQIQFFSKSDMQRYCKSMIEAVKKYEKAPLLTTPNDTVLKAV